MALTESEPAIRPAALTGSDIVAALALTALGLVLSPVVGFLVLLVD